MVNEYNKTKRSHWSDKRFSLVGDSVASSEDDACENNFLLLTVHDTLLRIEDVP